MTRIVLVPFATIASGIGLATNFSTDAWMQYGFEIEARVLIREYDFTHRGTIQTASGVDHALAETISNLVERGLSGLNHIASDDIGVDDGNSKLGKYLGDGGLAAGDATGQADTQWTLFGRSCHSEHQIKIRVPDRLTPKHCDPASCGQVRAKWNGHTAFVLAECHHGDAHNGTNDG